MRVVETNERYVQTRWSYDGASGRRGAGAGCGSGSGAAIAIAIRDGAATSAIAGGTNEGNVVCATSGVFWWHVFIDVCDGSPPSCLHLHVFGFGQQHGAFSTNVCSCATGTSTASAIATTTVDATVKSARKLTRAFVHPAPRLSITRINESDECVTR